MSTDPALPGQPGRRGVLRAAALAAGVLPLAACRDDQSPDPPEDVSAPAEVDPDEALLAAATRLEERMLAGLETLLADGPGLVRRTAQVHRAHLDLLDRPEPDRAPQAVGRPLRLGGIAAAEERLARRHAEAAVRASSGPFARVLAAMAASAAQQADEWRRRGGEA